MLRVSANDAHHAFAVDDFALVTNFSNGRAYFHFDHLTYIDKLCARDSSRKAKARLKLGRREEF